MSPHHHRHEREAVNTSKKRSPGTVAQPRTDPTAVAATTATLAAAAATSAPAPASTSAQAKRAQHRPRKRQSSASSLSPEDYRSRRNEWLQREQRYLPWTIMKQRTPGRGRDREGRPRKDGAGYERNKNAVVVNHARRSPSRAVGGEDMHRGHHDRHHQEHEHGARNAEEDGEQHAIPWHWKCPFPELPALPDVHCCLAGLLLAYVFLPASLLSLLSVIFVLMHKSDSRRRHRR